MKSPSDWLGLFAYKSLARFGQLCYIIYRKYIVKAFCPKITEKRAFGVAVFLSTKHKIYKGLQKYLQTLVFCVVLCIIIKPNLS